MKKKLAKIIIWGLVSFGIIFGTYKACSPEKRRGPSRIEQILQQHQGEEEGYDNSTVAVTDRAIKTMLDMTYKVEVTATYKSRFSNFRKTFPSIGSCFLAENKNGRQYFVTCEHVISPDNAIAEHWDIYDFEKAEIEILDEDNNRYAVEVIKSNIEEDIAILVVKDDLVLEKLIDFADLELKMGDAIYAVGNPQNRGEFLTDGIITKVDETSNFFYVNSALNPGNSGGPLYVLKDGVPYIAGIGKFVVEGDPYRGPPVQGMFGVVHPFYLQTELKKAIEDYEELQKEIEEAMEKEAKARENETPEVTPR